MGQLNEDIYVNGTLQARQLIPTAQSITDAHVQVGAAIAVSKTVHRHRKTYTSIGNDSSNVANDARLIHSCLGAAIVSGMRCTVVGGTSGTLTVDLQKGNAGSGYASILSASTPLSMSSVAARTPTAASVTSSSLLSGDSLRVVVLSPLTGTPATGLMVEVDIDENYV